MGVLTVELGIPYTGWPIRSQGDYEFGLDVFDRALREDVLDWAKDFNENFDDERGWISEEARASHAAHGVALRDRVQQALGADFRVVLNPMGAGIAEAPPN